MCLFQSFNTLGNKGISRSILDHCQINTTKVKKQFNLMGYLTSGYFKHLGDRCLGALASISPRYLSNSDNLSLFAAMASNYNYTYFTCDISRWDSMTEAIWGLHDMCSSLMQFQVLGITRVGLSAISQEGRWGDPKRPLCGMAYLLLVHQHMMTEEEWMFGLVGVWVHPNQALLPSLEEAVRKLTVTYQHKKGLALCLCL